MIGMRSGMGQKYGADTADPGNAGTQRVGPKPPKRKRRVPTNIKGIKKRKKKG